MPVSYLQVEHLTKSFGDKVLFSDISFGLSEGQKVALIAKNGMGKTTLLNILSGTEDYDSGTITFRRDLRVGYLHQQPEFDPEMNVLDACLQCNNDAVRTIMKYEHCLLEGDADRMGEVMAEMDVHKAWDYEARIKQILGKLRIENLSQKMGQLSGGQRKRVALANVLISEPELLILDEPTNHLDLEMVEWLEEFLRHSTMTLFMVTHDRYFLDRVCSDILEIDMNGLFHYKGNYAYYLEKRAERIENFNAETQRAQNLYRRELDWMRRQPQARGHKARSRIDGFYELEDRAKQRLIDDSIQLEVKASYIGSKIFEAQYVSKSYGDLKILDNFYYNFARYEKLGIVGKNGTGKSTFLKMLLGEVKPDSGTFDIGETVRFGYYRQDGLDFDEQMKVIDVVRDIAEEIDLGGGKKLGASQFLQHFMFSPETQNNFVYKLSGGERQRLHLCTVLIKNPNFLILDEPTNDLDIVTLNILEEYLRSFKGCLIVVSHDRYFMDKVVDHLLVFKGDGVIQDYPGNYTQYREWREEQERQKEKTNVPKVQRKPTSESKEEKPRRLTYKERMEYEALDKEIPELEAEKTAIEEKMYSGTCSGEEITRLSQRFAELNDMLDEKGLRWLELGELM